MRTTEQNRIKIRTASSAVLTNNQTTWQDEVAVAEGVDALAESLTLIETQSQLAEVPNGVDDVKDTARQALGLAVSELIGAMRAYAARTVNPEIAAEVAYAPAEVVAGTAAEIVVRCRAIHTVASAVAAELAPYGISATKFRNVQRKIDAFDDVRSTQCQGQVGRNPAV